MDERRTIRIQNRFNIVEARMQVRQLARAIGFDLFDQARISLAPSTMAIILGLERSGKGLIAMERLKNGGHVGLQVICTEETIVLHDLAVGVLDDAKQMVDDLKVESLSSGGVEVTMIKWNGKRKRHPASTPGSVPISDTHTLNT